jgi:hypothetical protein
MKELNLLFLILYSIKSEKRNSKIVLVFNNIKELDTLIKGFSVPSFKNVTKRPEISEDKVVLSKNVLDGIPLNQNTLCLLFKNLDELEKDEKLQDVYIDKIAINKDNMDRWNKLKFSGTTDSTGYFRGEYTDNYNLEKSMFFHVKDLDEDTKSSNVQNIKKLLYHISVLKHEDIGKIIKEECSLSILDQIIFKNKYKYEEDDNVKVCVCRNLECTLCDGMYDVKRTAL